MNEQYNNGFCPQCGALLKNGVCPCCQFGLNMPDSDQSEKSADKNPYGDTYDYNNQGFSQNPYGYTGQNTSQNMYGGSYSYSDQSPHPQKTKNYKRIAAVVGGLLALSAVVVIAAVSVFSVRVSKQSHDLTDSHDGYDWDYDWDDEYDDWDDDWDADTDYYYDYAQTIADDIEWNDKTWKREPDNCTPDELWDSEHRYYEEFKNCIHKNVDYKIKFKTEEQLDKDKNVCMRATYYQLEGDIPNLKEINKSLRDAACYYLDYYNEETDFFDDMFDDYGEVYIVSATSYLTYHDDSLLSVAINNQYHSVFASGIEVDCINIDLESGMILDNTEIIDPTKKFVKTVIDHSTIQNGSSDFLDNTDTQELQEMFEDEDSLIIFYTPCGLEVGLNYIYGSSYGWITTTLTDYEEYLKSY